MEYSHVLLTFLESIEIISRIYSSCYNFSITHATLKSKNLDLCKKLCKILVNLIAIKLLLMKNKAVSYVLNCAIYNF